MTSHSNDRSEAVTTAQHRLTLKQQRWIGEYLASGGNATRAAQLAYSTADYNTAKAIGHENLTKPHIRAEIARLVGDDGRVTRQCVSALENALDSPNSRMRLEAAKLVLKLLGC